MSPAVSKLNELCEEVEECGHHFALVIDIATSGTQLSERGKLGLTEYGMYSLRRFAQLEKELLNYRSSCIPN